MRKLIVGASLCVSLLIAGCAAKPQAKPVAKAAAPAPDPDNKVIVHIVSQKQTITVTSSPRGLLYSLKDPEGRVQIADATEAKFAELQPQLYHQIKNYIAVHADDAPIPSASVDGPFPANASRERSFSGPSSGVNSDQFRRTSDRPFPTAREDAP